MWLMTERVLTDSVEIDTTPDRLWGFFTDMDKNYRAWHPGDHVVCRWTKGKPHEVGSIVYAEEVLAGKLCKISMICTKIEVKSRIEYQTLFPLSLFHPRSMYLIEEKGKRTVFTAINYFRVPKLFGRRVKTLIDATEKHVKEEGENLKGLLERKNT